MIKAKYFRNIGGALLGLALYPYLHWLFYQEKVAKLGSVLIIVGFILTGLYLCAAHLATAKGKFGFLHCVSSACAFTVVIYNIALISILKFSALYLLWIIVAITLLALYFAGTSVKGDKLNTDGKYFKFVLLFGVLMAITDGFFIPDNFREILYSIASYVFMSYCTVIAVILTAIAYFLYCKNLLKPILAYILNGAFVVGGVTQIIVNYSRVMKYQLYPAIIICLGLVLMYIFLLAYSFLQCKKRSEKTGENGASAQAGNLSAYDKYSWLEELYALKQSGVINEDEYDAQKKKILGDGTDVSK